MTNTQKDPVAQVASAGLFLSLGAIGVYLNVNLALVAVLLAVGLVAAIWKKSIAEASPFAVLIIIAIIATHV
jgi:hypothetical protein